MSRGLALFLGAWLAIVQSDAGLFHACAAGNPAVATASSAASTEASTPSAVHGPHDHAAAVPSDTGTRHSHHPMQDGECHCIGQCCIASMPALPAVDFTFAVIRRHTASPPGRSPEAIMAAWVAYLLPYSTAPPVVRLA